MDVEAGSRLLFSLGMAVGVLYRSSAEFVTSIATIPSL